MASKGETKSKKKFAAPKVAKIWRKSGGRFTVRHSRGPHSADKSIPLAVAMRDLIGIASNIREVKSIINERKVFVDGKPIKDHRLPVGFMDVISFPNINKYYRVLYDERGRLIPKEIGAKESSFKLCKIANKAIVEKGRTQLNLHDGKNILYDKKCSTGDVLKMELPSLNVLGIYPLTEGSIAYITGGKHAGEIAVIKSIMSGTMMRRPLAVLDKDGKEFETRKDYVFVVGVKEPAIKL